MKNLIRITETDLKRIVNRVLSEEESAMDPGGLAGQAKSCRELGINYGKFGGEKDDKAFLIYRIDYKTGKQVFSEEGSPKMCYFKRYATIKLS